MKTTEERKRSRTILICLLLVVAVIVVTIASNPLRRSNETIRENILKITPLGTSMEDVIKAIEENGWELDYVNEMYGFGRTESGYRITDKPDLYGVKSVGATLGIYYTPFITYVEVGWGFDENSKLINVGVWKSTSYL